MIKISTDYIFQSNDKYLRVKIGNVNSTAMIEFFVSGLPVYYKPLFSDEIEILSDIELIAKVVKDMQKDRQRWLSNECLWITLEFENMNFHQRLTTYDYGCYEPDMLLTVIVNADKRVKLKLDTGENGGKLNIDLDISAGDDILDTAARYSEMLNKLIENFKLNRNEIPKATLHKKMLE